MESQIGPGLWLAEPGAIFRPRETTGSKMAAFNVTGAMLARDDFIEVTVDGERPDDGGTTWSSPCSTPMVDPARLDDAPPPVPSLRTDRPSRRWH